MNTEVKKTPQVLFLGNGINLAYGGTSWSGLIDKINVRNDVSSESMNSGNVPMPLQAILATNNNIGNAMKTNKSDFWGKINSEEQMLVLQEVLSMNFNDILTTNYSYELEAASVSKSEMSESVLRKMSKCTEGRVEPQYLLHSYNCVHYNGTSNRVWHIHGESRKPNSMIIGHYWYANQLARMKKESDNAKDAYLKCQLNGIAPKLDSWVDSFILGDVYVLGFGFSFSEIDLWWLLNRKFHEKAAKGKLYFYEMKNKSDYEKTELMRLLDAEIISLGFTKPREDDPGANEMYKNFYRNAISDIQLKMRGKLFFI